MAGVIIGAGWRAVTAGVIGANIGGAMVLLIGLPVATTLVGAAVLGALVDRSDQDPPAGSRRSRSCTPPSS